MGRSQGIGRSFSTSEAGSMGHLSNSGKNLLDAVIIVVAFNEVEGIGDCLHALLNQTTDQLYEVTVVDDGSSDGTSEVVESIQATDLRLNLIRHKVNRGRGAARRTGQDASVARHIGFVDADIIVPRDWLQRCSEALSENSAVSAVAIPDGDAAVLWRVSGAAVRFRVGFSGITGNNVIFDADVLRLEPFEAQHTLGEDFRVSQRLLRLGYKLKALEDLRVEHREAKKYNDTIDYMWEMGIDAATHPFEFRIVRLPDVTWGIWLLGCLFSLSALASGLWPWWLGVSSVLVVTAAISLIYTLSRFRFLPNPIRWTVCAIASVPFIIAYLAGRTWGIVRFGTSRRRRKV
jgi:glycosyltransferase involved in cell wall biosynthesis